jgi:hypothetical protein
VDAGADGSAAGACRYSIVPFDGGPTDIPLRVAQIQVPASDGGMPPLGFRLALPLTLGDAGPIDAWLDTGSEGIQVIADSMPSPALAAIQLGSTPVRAEFESGVTATGVVGEAFVTLGDRTTPCPIPVVVYQSFTCQSGGACASQDGGTYSADLFNGYPAIVGAGLRNLQASVPGVGSPIPQLPGQPSFIVQAPAYGASTGNLRIGPSAAEVAGFATFQLPPLGGGAPLRNGTRTWDDTAIPACVNDQTDGKDYCANAVLDTGSPATLIFWTGQSVLEELRPGWDVAVTIGPAGALLGQFDVMVSAAPQVGQDVFELQPPLPGAGNSINLGLTVFFRYDVYFDPASGSIGLLAH